MRTLGSRSYRFTAASKSRIIIRQPLSALALLETHVRTFLSGMGPQVVGIAAVDLREPEAILNADTHA